MRKLIHKWFNGPKIIQYLEKRRLENQKKKSGVIGEFYRAGGRDLLFDFPNLHSLDVVIDAGGYLGAWTERMLVKYGCICHVYEPLAEYAEGLRDRFCKNDRVQVFEEGLSGENGTAQLSAESNASSVYGKEATNGIEIVLRGVEESLSRADGKVGCLKMNIEGAEFDVFDTLETLGLASQIRYILVQFHDKVPEYEVRYQKAREFLNTHYISVWEFGRVWQLWQLKD